MHVIDLILLNEFLYMLHVIAQLSICAIFKDLICFQSDIVHTLDLLIDFLKLPVDLDIEVHLLRHLITSPRIA